MEKTEYFKFKNNFDKTLHIPSLPIFESKLDFNPKVTIAIPTYKRPEFLKETLESAINQKNFNEYDIIVVDNNPERDCDTEKLLLSFQSPRITYYKNSENMGMIGNLNRLYNLAKGKYVVELHDDDLLYPDYLSVMMNFIKQTNEKYDAILPKKATYNMNKSAVVPKRTSALKFFIQDLKVNDFLWGNIIGPPIGMCIKKHTFLKIGGYNYDFFPSIDYAFYVKFAHQFNICKLSGYPLSIYRIGENESCKTETLLHFVSCDTSIKKNILTLNKSRLNYFFWMRYINLFVFKHLNMMAKLYKNKEIKVENELLAMGFKYKRQDILLYRIMNFYRKVYFRFRKVAFLIPQSVS